MKRGSTLFLQVAIVLIGLGALALMFLEPQFEGRNVDATFFQIYFNDPFLAYVYATSIPFFVALHQAFILLGYISENEVFSVNAVKTLRTIKYCAMSIAGFITAAEIYLFIVLHNRDDLTSGFATGIAMIFLTIVIATAAAVFEGLLQTAVELKNENDLTV